ncbi:MAG: CDP-alcohol phosphatidyltransferase family protein [Chloroflexaceae bacterium]|nr:CDP-alcohol phosphatidyltransferase family protein [Chloroflexaceae bacterium]
MLDKILRSPKEQMLSPVAYRLLRPIHPTSITITAWAIGMFAAIAAWQQAYLLALLLWVLNRLLDGLDGTVARIHQKQTDLGGYLDVLLDTSIYCALPLGLALAANTPAVYLNLALLLGSFYLNTASWMYLAALLEKRQHGANAQQELTTVTMPGGLIEGLETMIFFALFLLFPASIGPLFAIMALLVVVTVIWRLSWAIRHV